MRAGGRDGRVSQPPDPIHGTPDQASAERSPWAPADAGSPAAGAHEHSTAPDVRRQPQIP